MIQAGILQQAISNLLEPRMFKAGAVLMGKLDQPGSGKHHEGNPNPSSAEGEYPAVQTGELLSSIDVQQVDYRTFEIGSFANRSREGFEHAVELESRPPSQGGRPFLEMVMADPDFRKTLL